MFETKTWTLIRRTEGQDVAGDVLQGGGRARGPPLRILQRRGEGQGGGGRGHHRLRSRSRAFSRTIIAEFILVPSVVDPDPHHFWNGNLDPHPH
jgi:hypothetical protein